MKRVTPDAPVVAGEVVRIGTQVRRLTCPNPGVMTGPGTNTYMVGDAELAVIDPGPEHAEHLDAILAAADGASIMSVITTHTHPDHSPNAAELARRTGAELVGFAERDGFVPTRVARDGDRITGPGFSLRAVHTPGHASNHLCWLLEEENLLFSGDHVMAGSTVVISPPDGDMREYLASLGRVRALGVDAIAPGHGPRIAEPDGVLSYYIEHRLAREQAVASALARAGSSTIDELVTAVYTDVDPALHPIARSSLWAHLRKLGDEGRAASDERDVPNGRWTARN